MAIFNVGDVCVPKRSIFQEGKVLRCGSGWYSHAIVGSIDPFVIVSDDGTMVWSNTWEPEDLDFLCQADEAVQSAVMTRMKRQFPHLFAEDKKPCQS